MINYQRDEKKMEKKNVKGLTLSLKWRTAGNIRVPFGST